MIAAILDDLEARGGRRKEILQAARERTGADYLIVVSGGDFLQDGRPAKTEKYQRAEEGILEGADMVLEIPVCVGLSDMAARAFSGVAMLKRLRVVEQLVILCHGVKGEELVKEARTLFTPSSGQRKRELSDPINQYAVEILRAIYQFYWVIEPVFLDIKEYGAGVWEEKGAAIFTPEQDAALAGELRLLVEGLTPEECKRRLENTPDGLPELDEYLSECLPGLVTQGSFLQIVKRIAKQIAKQIASQITTQQAEETVIRVFLLQFLIGVRKGSRILCGLRVNCPYGRVLALRDVSDVHFNRIEKTSWVPLLLESFPEGKRQGNLDECGTMLAELDDKAHELYLKIQSSAEERKNKDCASVLLDTNSLCAKKQRGNGE